jgi:hypothetical protein
MYAEIRRKGKGLGNGPSGPINGSFTKGSLHAVFVLMAVHMAFGEKSVFLDLGAGVGKVVFHALLFGVSLAIGIECEKYRWWTSSFFAIATSEAAREI